MALLHRPLACYLDCVLTGSQWSGGLYKPDESRYLYVNHCLREGSDRTIKQARELILQPVELPDSLLVRRQYARRELAGGAADAVDLGVSVKLQGCPPHPPPLYDQSRRAFTSRTGGRSRRHRHCHQ